MIYSQTKSLQIELEFMNTTLDSFKSNDLKIKELEYAKSLVEQRISKNKKEAKKLIKEITKYLTDNLTIVYNTYNDYKYKKKIEDLDTYQKSIFDDYKKLEDHDQTKIQSWLEVIHLCHTDVYDMEREQLSWDYESKLNQFAQEKYLNNVIKIELILSENKQNSDYYLNQVNSQIESLKASTKYRIDKQAQLK